MLAIVLVLAQAIAPSHADLVTAGYETLSHVLDGAENAPDLDALEKQASADVDTLEALGEPADGPSGLEAIRALDEQLLAKERSCRATPRCVAYRAFKKDVVAPMCEAADSIDRSRAEIVEERSNPSGIVDMQVLHDAGFSIQVETKYLNAYKAQFAAQMHRSWTRKDCP